MSDRHQIQPYPIRMPPELRERLENSAKSGNRSLHAEIVARLQASFAEPNLMGIPSVSGGRSPSETFRFVLEQQAEKQKEEIQKLVETSVGIGMEKLSEQLKDFERNERKRLMEIALGGAEPVSKTKKSKA